MRKPAEPPGRKHPSADSASALPPVSFPIIGIGSSAGGLGACITLLKSLKPDLGMAFVFVPHLAFWGENIFRELLGRATSMPAVNAEDSMTVQPNHVYVIPPKYDMTISHGKLHLVPLPQPRSLNATVDIFLRSLAADQGRDAIGIILSGMASDGTLGMAAVKAGGGTTFAQDASAKFVSMPNSAIDAGWVDLVLSPQGMAAQLANMGLLLKAASCLSGEMRRGQRRAAASQPERMKTCQTRQAAEPTEVGGPQSGASAAATETPAVVIAVVKSPRKLLVAQAQQLLADTNQVRLRFVELELLLASTLCSAADIDARMGNFESVLHLVGAVRRAVESAENCMAQGGGYPPGFKKRARARINRIRERMRRLERLGT